MLTVLALDIDGVLNGGQDYIALQGLTKAQVNDDPGLPYRFYRHGDFVNVEALERLQELVKETRATVVGVSSWFTSQRCSASIGSFLGLDIAHVASDTCGGEGRVRALGDLIAILQPDRLVILDDQPHYYTEYGFAPHHVKPVSGMLISDFNRAREIATQPLDINRLMKIRRIQDGRRRAGKDLL